MAQEVERKIDDHWYIVECQTATLLVFPSNQHCEASLMKSNDWPAADGCAGKWNLDDKSRTQFLFYFTAKGNLFFVFPRLGGTCRLGATKGHPSTSIRASGSPKKGAACRSLSKYFKWKRVDSLASITFRSKCFPLGKSATRRRRPIWSESLRTRRRWELQLGCNHSRRQLDTRLTWNYRKRGDR